MTAGGVVVQRNAAVLVWVPVLLAQPLLERPGGAQGAAALALTVLAAAACVTAVLASWPVPTSRAIFACLVLAGAVLLASTRWQGWPSAWLLVAMTAGVALPPRVALAAVPAAAITAGLTVGAVSAGGSRAVEVFVVALAGTTAGVLNQLLVTAETLRRTRQQLAIAAVAQERERVARDLHDVLGHTLSLMIVKAAAVRRLVHPDPDAAVDHARDIEEVGRSALGEVRRTIQDANRPTLEQEIVSAGELLAAAGIGVDLPALPHGAAPADEPLAWALREGVTNVLRHSGARHCSVELTHEGDTCRLTITDDGGGNRAPAASGNRGGIDGLRDRLELAGGGLDAGPEGSGFRLTAWLPHATAHP